MNLDLIITGIAIGITWIIIGIIEFKNLIFNDMTDKQFKIVHRSIVITYALIMLATIIYLNN